MSIDAEYSSNCPNCSERIEVGDLIVRDEDTGYYVHEGCGQPEAQAASSGLLKPVAVPDAEKCPSCAFPLSYPVHGLCEKQQAIKDEFAAARGEATAAPPLARTGSVSLASATPANEDNEGEDPGVLAAWVPEGKTKLVTLKVRPEPPRDGWGRYLLPGLDGKVKGHTRATTVCKEIDKRELLEEWKQRQVAAGIGLKPDLYALVSSHRDQNGADRKTYTDVVRRAHEAAGSNDKSAIGTALHRFTEMLDLGLMKLTDIPLVWRARCECYLQTMADNGITHDLNHVEQIFIDDRYGVAGTGDRVSRLRDRRLPVIADLKTGSIEYATNTIACQLAIYQDHTGTYDVPSKKRRGRIEMDPEMGLVIHLPQDGDYCHLHWFHLGVGREFYMAALELREIKRTKPEQVMGRYVPDNVLQPYDWIAQRLWALVGLEPAVTQVLAEHWPQGVRCPFPSDPTPQEVTIMDQTLQPLERHLGAPFSVGVAK